MNIDITAFFNAADPSDYSASKAERGQNVAKETWNAALVAPTLLSTDDEREAFREWVKQWGAWTDGEIAAWNDEQLNALCVQWVSGDMREAGLRPGMSHFEWLEYERLCERGTYCGRICMGDDAKVMWSME